MDQWNRIESQNNLRHIETTDFLQGSKGNAMEKRQLFKINGTGTSEQLWQNKTKQKALNPYLPPSIKININCMLDLHVKPKTMKFIEGENFHDVG